MRLIRACLLILLAAPVDVAVADEQRDAEARHLYEEGKLAYGQRDYAGAYRQFKAAYLLSTQPALLFNMASALKELGRPREAADALRTYLRLVPDDPEREAVTLRIIALDEAQRLLDEDRTPPAAPALAPPPSTAPPPGAPVLTLPLANAPASPSLIAAPSPPRPKRSVGLIIGIVAGAAVVLGAVVTGLALASRTGPMATSGSIPPIEATP